MTDNSQSISDLIPAITAKINDAIRHTKDDETQKGWGQFLFKNEHENQVGLYGTCAALMVRALNSAEAECDEGVLKFISSRKGRSKDFNQNARLAFLVWTLSFSTNHQLLAIRNEWQEELLKRQQADGGWGDSKQTDHQSIVSRPEVTALAIFALSASSEQAISSVEQAAEFLSKHINSRRDIAEQVDPFVIAAILGAQKKPDSRIRNSALAYLKTGRPNSDVRIFFFDYYEASKDGSNTKRDFFCVPQFFAYSSIACSRALSTKWLSAQLFTVSLARTRAINWLIDEIDDGIIAHPASSHFATVDQAFAALSAKLLADNPPQFASQVWWLSRLIKAIRKPRFIKMVISVLLLAALGAFATDPELIIGILTPYTWGWVSPTKAFIVDWSRWIQIGAITLGGIFGQTLLGSIYAYFRSFFGELK